MKEKVKNYSYICNAKSAIGRAEFFYIKAFIYALLLTDWNFEHFKVVL